MGTHVLLDNYPTSDVLGKHKVGLTRRAVGSAKGAVLPALLGAMSCLPGAVPPEPQWEVGSCCSLA